MAEVSIKAYSKEAERLFQRGVAAARGGQRRIAAGLLTRAVQLDPRHEAAWLWLSGVLDDPHDILFCLRAALKLNPNNQRAQAALRFVEQRRGQEPAPATASAVRSIDLDPAPVAEPEHETPFWFQFKESLRQQFNQRIKKGLAVAGLSLAVIMTGNLYQTRRGIPLPPMVVQPTAAPIVVAPQQEAPVQQTLRESPEVARAEILAYLSRVQLLRDDLSAAARQYRADSQQVMTGLEQVTAARSYRDKLRASYSALEQIEPPEGLREPHATYLTGLQLEEAALDDLLQFYGEYNVALANRAALRLQEAGSYLSQARTTWAAYHDQIALQSASSSFSAR